MKRIRAKCGVTDSVVVKETSTDSIREIVRLKDTTVYLTVNGPVQYLPNPCALLCDSLGNLKSFESTERKNSLTSRIFTTGNVLAVDCNADSLKAVIRGLQQRITHRTHTQTRTVNRTVTVPVPRSTGWQVFCTWLVWLQLVALCIYLIIKRLAKR